MGLAQEFKDFAVKGNVVDMAVGLIIGAEFGKIVNSLVADVIMPPIGLLVGNVDFKNLFLTIKESATHPGPYMTLADAQKVGAVTLNIGSFITTLITFTIIAFAVFMLVRVMNRLRAHPASKNLVLLGLLFLFQPQEAMAEEGLMTAFKNESQLAVVKTSGNSKTESYSLKQSSSYTKDKNTYKAFGSYLKTQAQNELGQDEETAKRWDAGTRYERQISTLWSGYIGYLIESDVFAGFNQRHNTDLGAKYLAVNKESFKLITEAGYRYVHQNNTDTNNEQTHYNSARLFAEGTYQLNPTNSFKLSLEHLPNFDNRADHLTTLDSSLSSALNALFSLKVSYVVKRDNVPVANAVKTDTTLTTALVAKF